MTTRARPREAGFLDVPPIAERWQSMSRPKRFGRRLQAPGSRTENLKSGRLRVLQKPAQPQMGD